MRFTLFLLVFFPPTLLADSLPEGAILRLGSARVRHAKLEKEKPDIGHTKEIWRIAYSPDGKIIATCSLDRTARLWDAKSGKPLHTLKGHEAGIFGMSFSADGKTLYTAAHDGTVREWDVNTGKGKVRFQSIPGRADDIHRNDYFWAVACSPDSHWLAASNSNASWLYLMNSKSTTPRIERASGTVYFLSFSSQGKLAMGGPVRDGISIIDPMDANWRREFGKVTAEASTHDLAFAPDGNYLASTGVGLKIWDIETGILYREFQGTGTAPRCVAYSPDGKSLATDNGKSILLWEIATGKHRATLGANHTTSGNINAVAFAPDGNCVTAGYDDGTALSWDNYFQAKSTTELTSTTMDALWKTLAETDALTAYASMRRFRSNPEKSVAYLDKAIHQLIQGDLDRVDQLIRQLDDDRFAVREKATKELIRIGNIARIALERATGSKSEEVSLRAKRALEAIPKNGGEASFPDALRATRALEILEAVGDGAAIKVLQSIRDSQLDTPLIKESKAALARIENRKNLGERQK